MDRVNMRDEDIPADLPGNDKRRKQRQRNEIRGGYDDDSDYEEGVPAQAHSIDSTATPNKEVQEESDDDMFASDKDEKDVEVKSSENRPKNDENWPHGGVLDMDEFEKTEGIEQSTVDQTNLGRDQLNEDELDYYNNPELATSKARNEPILAAFNLREEAEEGTYDKDGNYTKNKSDDDEPVEHWLETSEKDIAKARESQLKRENAASDKKRSKSLFADQSTEDIVAQLIELLEPVETPLEALARLAPKKKKTKRRQNHNGGVSDNGEESKRAIVVEITGICQELVARAIEAYDLEREELMRLYKSETGHEFVLKRRKRPQDEYEAQQEQQEEYTQEEQKIWEFRWVGDTEIHGPHSSYEMLYWKDNYFENNVEVRKIGPENDFVHVEGVSFEYS